MRTTSPCVDFFGTLASFKRNKKNGFVRVLNVLIVSCYFDGASKGPLALVRSYVSACTVLLLFYDYSKIVHLESSILYRTEAHFITGNFHFDHRSEFKINQ